MDVGSPNQAILNVENANFGLQNGNLNTETAFRPAHRVEEAFLLLNISHSLLCKEAVLSRAEEHREAREK
uniref:Tetratricopeptide repeat protein 7 N-terminal domain-containing protein n=1 Tax=Romanomermis culicivorax TaxID=13658 RepID=A0A915HR19_ROMCU